MKLRTIAASIMIGCLCAGAVSAAGEMEKREGLMKGIGGAMGALGAIAKGEKPYDAETVKTAVTTISANAKAFPDQFPAGSEGGAAAPAIWQNFADFKSKSEKLGSDADMVLAQLPTDQASVGAALKTLGADCSSCHQTYRLKK
ncbi:MULTISPECIES: cytochrome c [Rhizobium/Agrobacterium group]|jgi:cytochrome c556|uniref:c-type cytochrome n=1 Tax=Rhizobium/Agrobacterium group TaxID=227290 RepID=UPI000712769B|nr:MULTISPECIES: cytochrome c [Rhizobium/Agrobacterium group]KQQ58528.1 cytochrome C556 [Rhizobium sp. Leaf311]